MKRPPSLSIFKKSKEKEGLYWRKHKGGLKRYSMGTNIGGGNNGSSSESDSDGGEDDEDQDGGMGARAAKIREKEEKKDKKKRKNAPTVKEIREWMRDMVTIYEKSKRDEVVSVFNIMKKSKKGGANNSTSQIRARALDVQGIPCMSKAATGRSSNYVLAHEAHKVMQ